MQTDFARSLSSIFETRVPNVLAARKFLSQTSLNALILLFGLPKLGQFAVCFGDFFIIFHGRFGNQEVSFIKNHD